MSPDTTPQDPRQYLEPAGTRVRDPLTNKSMWLAGMLTEARIEEGTLHFNVEFGADHRRDDRGRMVEALLLNLKERWKGEIIPNVMVEGVRRGARSKSAPKAHNHEHGHAHAKEGPKKDPVRGMSGPGMAPHGGPMKLTPLAGVKHIIAVASGKGGVGKSTIATNLAISLHKAGHAVGLMDADIYGPSLPLMMNVSGRPMANPDRKILPLVAHGVKCMSIGFMVDEGEPIIWRGPMVMGVVRQFLQDVAWAPLDYLIVDLPPGTGDAQLTMIQNVPIAGAVIVTTPQDIALLDADRGLQMFTKLDVPVLGVIENMSWFEMPDGSRQHPFGKGGGQRMAGKHGVSLLGQLPLDGSIREGGDTGKPAVLAGGTPATVFNDIVTVITRKLPL